MTSDAHGDSLPLLMKDKGETLKVVLQRHSRETSVCQSPGHFSIPAMSVLEEVSSCSYSGELCGPADRLRTSGRGWRW